MIAAPIPSALRPLHALNRLGFGPRPGDLDAVKGVGVERWIDAIALAHILAGWSVARRRRRVTRLTAGQLYQDRDLAITIDFRDPIAQVLRAHLGLNQPQLARVFPDFPSGRSQLNALIA